MGDYKVTMEKQSVVKGISKKFYHIDCNGERLYSDIALFESAMIVVMKLIEDKDVDKILELDNMYCGALQEAAHYKMKSKKVNESFKFDLAQAKQQSAVTRMTKIKNQIKSHRQTKPSCQDDRNYGRFRINIHPQRKQTT